MCLFFRSILRPHIVHTTSPRQTKCACMLMPSHAISYRFCIQHLHPSATIPPHAVPSSFWQNASDPQTRLVVTTLEPVVDSIFDATLAPSTLGEHTIRFRQFLQLHPNTSYTSLGGPPCFLHCSTFFTSSQLLYSDLHVCDT